MIGHIVLLQVCRPLPGQETSISSTPVIMLLLMLMDKGQLGAIKNASNLVLGV